MADVRLEPKLISISVAVRAVKGGAPKRRRGKRLLHRSVTKNVTVTLNEETGNSPLFELACMLVRFDHIARCVVNVNHSIVRAAVKLCVSDCVADLRPACRTTRAATAIAQD